MTTDVFESDYVKTLLSLDLPYEIVIDELKRINQGHRPTILFAETKI